MEGRVNSDYYRNTSEELFIKSMMESSNGMPAPTLEMLGFKNLSQNLRTDSEELFKSWLTNGENNGCSSTSIGTRTRQASRRMSTEQSNLSNQQTDGILQIIKTEDIPLQQNTSNAAEASGNPNECSLKNVDESGWEAHNLFVAKAWFNSSQPMTRSRSSELRRRYTAMQNLHKPVGAHTTTMHNVPENGVNGVKQEFTDLNGFSDVHMCEGANQFNEFTSASNLSSSTFNTSQEPNVDEIYSVVSMLKGTLERKKLSNKLDKEAVNESRFGYYGAEVLGNMNLNEEQDHSYEMQGSFQDLSTLQISDTDAFRPVDEPCNVNEACILLPKDPIEMSIVSSEHSPNESSATPPVVSSAYDVFEDFNYSGKAPTDCQSSKKQSVYGPKPTDIREHTYDNLKDDTKKRGLVRHGSVTSAGSGDQGDQKKKRRVERSRKMAEAKERNSTPAIPSCMQSLLKRCENLDKEVRSLKLNLAFMNRKDSEQTKQIEELEKENKELLDEKQRLLEEIERIIVESGKM